MAATRGTLQNPAGRFEKLDLEEGDYRQWSPDDPLIPSRSTQFFKDTSRTIIHDYDSPDLGRGSNVNAYRGCEHGCIYCFARPTHEYLGLSAGADFETKIFVKTEAPRLLREKLMSPGWTPRPITFSGITDCYQPAERKFRLTRACIEVLSEFRNPFTIITKNHLVTRDLDLIAPMAELNAAAVFVSVTSLDSKLAEKMEPRTSRPTFRLKAIEALARRGVPVGVMVAPIVPGLTDHELPAILKAVASAGATRAGYVMLRLPYGLGQLFEDWLVQNFPERKEKILNRIREMRGGKLYDSAYGTRMTGEGAFAEQVSVMFDLYSKKEGLNRERRKLSTEHFFRPDPHGQLSFGL